VRIKRGRALPGKIWILVVVLLVLGAAVTGCVSRAQPKGWSGARVEDDGLFVGSIEGKLVGLDKADGSRLWPDSTLGTEESGVAIYGIPGVAGDLVYVGGYNGKVYAVNSDTGALRWVYPREGNLEPIVGGVVASQGKVYFGDSDGKVYALDAATGDRVWQSFETGDRIWSTPVLSEGTIYIVSFDKKLYALNADDGSKKWEFAAGGALVSPPLIQDDTIYVGAFDRHVYAVDSTNGSLRWRSEAEGGKWFWAKPVVHNNTVYAPCLDGKVYIIDAEDGGEVTSAVELGDPVSSSPVVVNDKVVIASQEGKVYSLDTSNNQVSLLVNLSGDGQKIQAPLGASDGVVYVHIQNSKEDSLHAVNVETRVTLWSQSLISEVEE
jgi:outer membrane protein assembly factor BamB